MMPYSNYSFYQAGGDDYVREYGLERTTPCALQHTCPYYTSGEYYRQPITGSWSLGPITVSWYVSLNRISITVNLSGTTIAQGNLIPSLTSIAASGSALGFSAQIALRADFSNRRLIISGIYCIPAGGCHPINNLIIARW